MAAAAGRGGAHTMNFMHFKPMLRKAYHRKSTSPDMINSDHSGKLNGGEEVKNKSAHEGTTWWVPDERTGIFYPRGQEKVMQDVPPEACKSFGNINWFSSHGDF